MSQASQRSGRSIFSVLHFNDSASEKSKRPKRNPDPKNTRSQESNPLSIDRGARPSSQTKSADVQTRSDNEESTNKRLRPQKRAPTNFIPPSSDDDTGSRENSPPHNVGAATRTEIEDIQKGISNMRRELQINTARQVALAKEVNASIRVQKEIDEKVDQIFCLLKVYNNRTITLKFSSGFKSSFKKALLNLISWKEVFLSEESIHSAAASIRPPIGYEQDVYELCKAQFISEGRSLLTAIRYSVTDGLRKTAGLPLTDTADEIDKILGRTNSLPMPLVAKMKSICNRDLMDGAIGTKDRSMLKEYQQAVNDVCNKPSMVQKATLEGYIPQEENIRDELLVSDYWKDRQRAEANATNSVKKRKKKNAAPTLNDYMALQQQRSTNDADDELNLN